MKRISGTIPFQNKTTPLKRLKIENRRKDEKMNNQLKTPPSDAEMYEQAEIIANRVLKILSETKENKAIACLGLLMASASITKNDGVVSRDCFIDMAGNFWDHCKFVKIH